MISDENEFVIYNYYDPKVKEILLDDYTDSE
jgi:hypothetical protein